MDLFVRGSDIKYSFGDEKKEELMLRINRIIRKHQSIALEYIKKAYEEYENENKFRSALHNLS